MVHKIIYTDQAPGPGNYSQATLVDPYGKLILHISGIVGEHANDSLHEKAGDIPIKIWDQTLLALKNIESIIKEVGGDMKDIAKVVVYMEDMLKNKTEFENAYRMYLKNSGVDSLPARVSLGVSTIPLPKDNAKIELDVTAYISKDKVSEKYR